MSTCQPGLALLSLGVLCAACGPEPVGFVKPLVQTLPAEVAFRDGDGPWQLARLESLAPEWPVTDPHGRYGLAVTERAGNSTWSSVTETTLQELSTPRLGRPQVESLRLPDVRSARSAVVLTGLRTGLTYEVITAQDQVRQVASSATERVELVGDQDGLVVLERPPDGRARLLLRPDLRPAEGEAPPVADFSAASRLAERPVSVQGLLPGEELRASAVLRLTHTPVVVTVLSAAGQGGTVQVPVLPGSLSGLAAPLSQEICAWTQEGGRPRSMRCAPVEAGQAALTLPPFLHSTASVEESGQVRWAWSGRPVSSDGAVHLQVWTSSLGTTASVFVSAAWRRGLSSYRRGSLAATPLLAEAWPVRSSTEWQLTAPEDGPGLSWRIERWP